MANESVSGSIFLSLGNGLQRLFDTFAQSVVNSFVADVLALLPAGLFLYFLIKGWLIMSGRSRDAIPDLIMNVGIMAMVITLGISTMYTFELASGVVMWLENFLVGHMPEFSDSSTNAALITSPWNWLDFEWNKFSKGLDHVTAAIDEIPWDSPGLGLSSALSWWIAYAGGAWFFFTITSVFVLNKIVITILIAFTPVFMGLAVFPLTREFTENWFKTLLAYTLALVLVLVLGSLFMHIFDGYADNIGTAVAQLNSGEVQGAWNNVNEALFVITMMSLIMSFAIRQIPAMAQGLIGRFIGAGGIVGSATVIAQTRADVMSAGNAATTARNATMAPYAAARSLSGPVQDLSAKAGRVVQAANAGGIDGLKAAMGFGQGNTTTGGNTSGFKAAPSMSTFTANKAQPGQTQVNPTASGATQFTSTGQQGYNLHQGSINLGQTSHSAGGAPGTPGAGPSGLTGGPGSHAQPTPGTNAGAGAAGLAAAAAAAGATVTGAGSASAQSGTQQANRTAQAANQTSGIPAGAYHARFIPGSIQKGGGQGNTGSAQGPAAPSAGAAGTAQNAAVNAANGVTGSTPTSPMAFTAGLYTAGSSMGNPGASAQTPKTASQDAVRAAQAGSAPAQAPGLGTPQSAAPSASSPAPASAAQDALDAVNRTASTPQTGPGFKPQGPTDDQKS